MVVKKIPALLGNYAKNRAGKSISEITIHHAAGNISVDAIGAMWQTPGRQVSSHYGINGVMVAQYIDEKDTSYCNGNLLANQRAVTIEVANSLSGKSADSAGWPITEDSLSTLIELVADIAKRNNMGLLVAGKSLTWHSMYRATACPGPFLLSKIPYIADEANKINSEINKDKAYYKVINITLPDGTKGYGVMRQLGAYKNKINAEAHALKLNQEE